LSLSGLCAAQSATRVSRPRGEKMVDDFYFTISINEILIGLLVLVGVIALGVWTLEKLIFAPRRKDRA